MLPTFVIGLREGVEASLIIGIIAAFLGAHGRRDVLRWMWVGVSLAAGMCLAIGIALRAVEGTLDQRQQESLETVVALVAVCMVSYMIVWMRRHARDLRGEVELHLADALAHGSVKALVAMAFLAVFREGLETAVFLVAVFEHSDNTAAAGGGAIGGLALAVVVGYALYRGGLRINLARFFRATGVVLVLVVAGLLASAAHTAHEASWLNIAQGQVVDLSSFIRPGSVQSALATGMLGIQPRPVVAEVVAWLVAAIPLMLFVLWPSSPRSKRNERAAAVNAPRVPADDMAGTAPS
ncbi:MAG: high-affinity iron transporter [Acidimicrobiaceae bacterium]|jgi:high-affinity iron transporter